MRPAESLEIFENHLSAQGYHVDTLADTPLHYAANTQGTGFFFINKDSAEGFSKKSLDQVLHKISQRQEIQLTPMLIKDSEKFFRSAAGHKDLKTNSTTKASLNDYLIQDRSKMILLTPHEKTIRNNFGNVTYLQPDSPRLDEEIVKYSFKPVLLEPVGSHWAATPRYSKSIFLADKQS